VFSVGWSGWWRATATWSNASAKAHVIIGHGDKVALSLKPGESFRTMAVVTVGVTVAETAAALELGTAGAPADTAVGPVT
jgi:hypothetical protein